jgi:prepilin-type processing-associated H-X9-DG protein
VDSGGVVVTAGWGGTDGVEITWDDLLDSYLGGSLTREGKNQASYIAEKTAPDLWCPADRSRREEDRQAPPGVNRRSYAMPQYLFDPERAPWPPRSRSRAGVGIVWDFRPGSPAKETTRQLWQSADYFQSGDLVYARKPQRQPAVESGQVRAPAVTILFAEQPAGPGWRGALAGAVITVPAVQQEIDPFEEARAIGPRKAPAELRREPWHGERFHYLMVDGHAEPLPPSKTVLPGASLRRQSGMWTISARD